MKKRSGDSLTPSMHPRPIRVLITDMDNTLYDWFFAWHQSFSALLTSISEISGISEDDLKPEIRRIHQARGTAEYSFLIEEMPSLKAKHGDVNLLAIYDDAIHEFRKARIRCLQLYPGVENTLRKLRNNGTLLVGYTDSLAFHTLDRIRRLKLDGLLHFVYSPADHEFPIGLTHEQVRRYAGTRYELSATVARHVPAGERKPNPQVLKDILKDVHAAPEDCIYVGDSLLKDVGMAQDAGVVDVYAKYGVTDYKDEYDLLRAVSHWTDEDVEAERRLKERDVTPSHVLNRGFDELLDLFHFVGAKSDER